MNRSSSNAPAARQRAETVARENAARSADAAGAELPAATQMLSHELQNDELRPAQAEPDNLRAHYFYLYDRAPVGYCTISASGEILQANRMAGIFLGIDPNSLINRRFTAFIVGEDLQPCLEFLNRVFESGHPQSCALRLAKNDGSRLWVQLSAAQEAHANAAGRPDIRLVLTDISELQKTLIAWRDSEERYRTAFRLSPNAITITRLADGLYQDVNDGFTLAYGWTRDEVIGKTAQEIGIWKNPTDRQLLVDTLKRDGCCENFETELLTRNGEEFRVAVSAHLITLENDPCLLAITHDITERKRVFEELREQKEFFHLIAESISDFIAVLDLGGRRIYNSPSYRQFFGANSALPGSDSFAQVHPDDQKHVKEIFDDTVRTGQGHQLEYRMLIPDGSVRIMESSGSVIRNREGQVTRVVVVSHDITERKRMEDQVRQMAFHDTLTRLPNRRLFSDRLTQVVAAMSRSGYYGAVMFLDLDNFKPLNDMHGHDVGDQLLIEVAERLRSCVREMDTVARFGGDEFVVMIGELAMTRPESIAEARIIAEKIRLRLAEPYHLAVKRMGMADATVEHRCTASIGVVVFTDHEISQDNILKRADAAMYQAKASGRNSVRFADVVATPPPRPKPGAA
jgi:diguanylate cyclase (GGDEF)-like protein/PAS domain S-box-containing protein